MNELGPTRWIPPALARFRQRAQSRCTAAEESMMKKFTLASFAAGVWVNLSEFLRNELLFQQRWLDKYEALRLPFPSAPINGAFWAAWGFLLSACIVALRRRLSFAETFLVSWTMAFPLMWIVIGNLNVLPFDLLPVAVPWSMAEVALAVAIAQKVLGKRAGN